MSNTSGANMPPSPPPPPPPRPTITWQVARAMIFPFSFTFKFGVKIRKGPEPRVYDVGLNHNIVPTAMKTLVYKPEILEMSHCARSLPPLSPTSPSPPPHFPLSLPPAHLSPTSPTVSTDDQTIDRQAWLLRTIVSFNSHQFLPRARVCECVCERACP